MMIFLISTLLFNQFDDDHLRMITSIKVAEMAQLLELDKKQIAEIIPKMKKLDSLHFDFQKRRQKLVRELKLLLKSESKSKVLKIKLDEYKELLEDFQKNEEEYRKEIEKLLTTEQKAKFFIFQDEFDHRLRKFIFKLRGEPPHRRIQD